MNTARSETVIDTMVNPIWLAPLSAARSGDSPFSMKRETFSVTTIASSTTKPVAMVSAIKDRLLRLYPSRYIAPKVPIRLSGTATLGMVVAQPLRRKTKTTSTTRATLRSSVVCTSATDARMVVLRSSATFTSMAGEMERASSGRSFCTRSITSTMLAPGCRRMISSTARSPSHQAAARWFSTSSITRATSPSRTGVPSR